MTDAQAFSLLNAIPLVGWIALAFAPLRRPLLVATARVAAVAVAVGYLLMVVASLSRGGPMPDLLTLPGLARAFSDPHVMLVGWAHYLALDLWTGAWEAEDAERAGAPHWAVLPCFVLTFLAGPIGLLAYLSVRAATRGRRRISSAASPRGPGEPGR